MKPKNYFETPQEEIDDALAQVDAAMRTPNLPRWFQAALQHDLEWLTIARPKQLTPRRRFRTWALICGRGFGKTRTGAEDAIKFVMFNHGVRHGVVAPHAKALRDNCFEGDSGIYTILKSFLEEDKDFKYNRTRFEIEIFPTNSFIQGIAAEEPENLRGPNWHRAWADEFGSWKKPEMAWKMLNLCLRLKTKLADGVTPDPNFQSQVIMTTTPKQFRTLRDILEKENTIVTKGSTYENRENLDEEFFAEIISMDGTELGRQEIYAEIIDFSTSAPMRREKWKIWKGMRNPPKPEMVLISLDTGFKTGKKNDHTACVVLTLHRVARKKRNPTNPAIVDLEWVFIVVMQDAWKAKLLYPDLRDVIVKEHDKWQRKMMGKEWNPNRDERFPVKILIEDRASGQSLLQEFYRSGVPAVGYNPGNDSKIMRANMVSDLFVNGLVWGLGAFDTETGGYSDKKFSKGVEACVKECDGFTGVEDGREDDFVDALSQGLQFLRNSGYLSTKGDRNFKGRSADDDFEDSAISQVSGEAIY